MADPSADDTRIPAEERVFSLVLALVASPQGLTKTELLSSVYGYADRYRRERNAAAIERQFERDKEQIRQLGVPIDTLDDPSAPGDNRLTRYRISKDRLQLPAGLRFTAEELNLLRSAALAWSDGSLGEESRWSTMRLTALGAGLDVRHLGIAPQLSMPEPSAPALQQAIDSGRAVRFDYQLPDRDAPLSRRVAPLRLHRAEQRWHLIAYDLERSDDRVFLLSRIASEVELLSERVDPALEGRIDAVLADLGAVAERQTVRVTVRPGSVAEARLQTRARVVDDGAMELATLDYHALASELAGFGDEATVLHPAALRELVVAQLRRVREQHLQDSAPEACEGFPFAERIGTIDG